MPLPKSHRHPNPKEATHRPLFSDQVLGFFERSVFDAVRSPQRKDDSLHRPDHAVTSDRAYPGCPICGRLQSRPTIRVLPGTVRQICKSHIASLTLLSWSWADRKSCPQSLRQRAGTVYFAAFTDCGFQSRHVPLGTTTSPRGMAFALARNPIPGSLKARNAHESPPAPASAPPPLHRS